MAYGQIIYTAFYDISGDLWELEIEQQGYAGAVNNINKMGVPPMRFDFGKSAVLPFKKPIFDTRLNFTLESLSTLQLNYLFHNHTKQHLVTVKHKGNVFFKGFLVGDTYSEPFKPAPFFVSFNAIDGLFLLKNRDWDISERLTQLEVITRCLAETGLTLDFTTSIQTDLITPEDAINPLENVYEPGEVYINEDSTYFDVLEDVLKKYGATIRQVNGVWEIAQFNGQAYTLPETRTYNSSGVLIDTGTVAGVLTPSGTGINNGMIILNSSFIRINPSFKEFIINQELGPRDNILRNGDFSEWYVEVGGIFPQLKYWTSNVMHYQMELADRYYALLHEATTENPYDEIYEQITDPDLPRLHQFVGRMSGYDDSRENREIVNLSIEIKYGLLGSQKYELKGDVYAQIKMGGLSARVQQTETGVKATWWVGDHVFKLGRPIARKQENVYFDTFSVQFSSFRLQDGDVEVTLYSAINCDEIGEENIYATVFDSVDFKVTTVNKTKPDDNKEIYTLIDANSNFVPPEIDIIVGDLPTVSFGVFTYDNYLSVASNAPTQKWRYVTPEGYVVEDELLIILAAQVEGLFAKPRLLMQANIVSDLMRFNSRISDPVRLPGVAFAILRASFEPKRLSWQSVEMLELNVEILPDFDGGDFDNEDFFTD